MNKSYIFSGAVVLTLVGAIIYQYNVIKSYNDKINEYVVEQKRLSDEIVRSQSQYATKQDIDDYAKLLDVKLKPIKEDLKTFGAQIQGINNVSVITPGYSGSGIKSTTTTPRPDITDVVVEDDFGYLRNRQQLSLVEPFSDDTHVPFGNVGFSAWKDSPWDISIYSRKYSITNVMGVDENGRHYVYNKFSVIVDGKSYDVPINYANFLEKHPESKFRFDPHIFLGISSGMYVSGGLAMAANPNVQLYLFSHGKTKISPDWIFFGVGAGYESVKKQADIIVSPVGYNVANHLPLVRNLYIGPSLGVGTNTDVSIMVSIGAGM